MLDENFVEICSSGGRTSKDLPNAKPANQLCSHSTFAIVNVGGGASAENTYRQDLYIHISKGRISLFFPQTEKELNAHKCSFLETHYTWEDMQISHEDETVFSVKLCSVNIWS